MLNKQQQEIHDAIIKRYYNHEQLSQFEGPAGSGKTYLIFEILKTLNLDPHQVLAMAYTGAAALVMRRRGFSNATTIHSALYELVETPDYDNIDSAFGIPKMKYEFKKRDFIDPNIKLFFIDEAGMVPDNMVKDILSFGVPVIACGDLKQLPPVGDNPGFLVSGEVLHLTQLMRQAESDPIVYLAMRATKGLAIHNGNYGNVIVINDNEFLPQMIGYADVVLCGTNKTRELMNSQIRQMAGFNSILPRVGERIICRKNNWQKTTEDNITLVNGLTGVVTNQLDYVDPTRRDIFKLDFLPDGGYVPFRNLNSNYEYFVSNYERKNQMKTMRSNYDKGEFFEYAYALSVHLSQGSEYDKGIYIEEFMRPQIQNQLNYTAITRFKHSMIYIRKTNKNIYIPSIKNN